MEKDLKLPENWPNILGALTTIVKRSEGRGDIKGNKLGNSVRRFHVTREMTRELFIEWLRSDKSPDSHRPSDPSIQSLILFFIEVIGPEDSLSFEITAEELSLIGIEVKKEDIKAFVKVLRNVVSKEV